MKKQNWISIFLIAACLGVLLGYRVLDRILTDSIPPVITVSEEPMVFSALESRNTLLRGVSARDEVDGDVTDSLVVESVRLLRSDGTVTVTYAAFDKAGNVAKTTREVCYSDYERPVFSLKKALLFPQMSHDLLSIISAWDILDGDISHRVRATALEEVTSGYNGTYDVQFQVTNSLGDTVELVLPVEVYTPGLFEANLTLTDYLVYIQPGDNFNARSYLNTFSQGRNEFSLRGGVPEELNLTVSGKVETSVPGIYVIDYRITYRPNAVSDQVYTAYSRLIVVVEG